MTLRPALFISLICLTFASASSANTQSLQTQRETVIKEYLADLAAANYQDIALLFDPNGYVVSTSRGHANAKEFFYAFLPNVTQAHTTLHAAFLSGGTPDTSAARFHLDFQLKDGETGNGEYMDEFVFNPGSTKLAAVYMFENLQFPQA